MNERPVAAPGLAPALELARNGRLYPAVILYGGVQSPVEAAEDKAALVSRREAALELARTLLCLVDAPERPCGRCRHCARIAWPGEREEKFHPDFRVLERDTKIATSVDATKALVQVAQSAPFEARGQVLVIASAETLSGDAANTLLKMLEEPPSRSPRHFLLLAPSRLDLLPTLRSRSLSVYLGAGDAPGEVEVEKKAAAIAAAVDRLESTGAGVFLLEAASALTADSDFTDLRASRPWSLAAAGAREAADRASSHWRRPLLDLADALLQAPDSRLRGIPADRIAEGLVATHLAPALRRIALSRIGG